MAHLVEYLPWKFDPQHHINQAWRGTSVVLEMGKCEQDNQQFEVSLGYSELKAGLGYMRPCHKQKTKTIKQKRQIEIEREGRGRKKRVERRGRERREEKKERGRRGGKRRKQKTNVSILLSKY